MFINGRLKGLNKWIPTGGQFLPMINLGLSLKWKYVQKNLKKNIISEIINKIIPQRIPAETILVCWPKYVASVRTSFHQENAITMIKIIAEKVPCHKKFWNLIIKDNVKNQERIAVFKGQNEGSVIW